jgi:hypothetical protein
MAGWVLLLAQSGRANLPGLRVRWLRIESRGPEAAAKELIKRDAALENLPQGLKLRLIFPAYWHG